VETHGRAPSARAETRQDKLSGHTILHIHTSFPPIRASVSFDTALKRPIEGTPLEVYSLSSLQASQTVRQPQPEVQPIVHFEKSVHQKSAKEFIRSEL